MDKGRCCDNCGRYLSEDEYMGAFSWSYDCSGCGFQYYHSSVLTAEEQVQKFENDVNSENE